MNNTQNIKELFKTLNIVYLAMIAGQILFCVVVFVVGNEEGASKDMSIFQTIVPAVSIGTLGVSFLLYNQRRQAGKAIKGLREKADHYRVSNIIRFALVEGGNLVAVVAVLLTGSTFFLLFFVLGLAVFAIYRPSSQGFIKDYELSMNEQNNLKEALK